MKTPAALGALIGCATAFATLSFAAESSSWPWNDKAPVDPALALLNRIDAFNVSIAELKTPTLSILVEAEAPTPGFTEVKLTPRIGGFSEGVFAFDVRGRRPQEAAAQVLTPVKIDVEYPDAPLSAITVVEVYAKENCKAFSLKDKTEVECLMNPGSQDAP
jgi:hypothetical protein